MLFVSLALFILAAIVGLMNFMFVIRKKAPPKAVVYTHGTFALLGIMSIIVIAMAQPHAAPYAALLLFILAAMGGLTMFVKGQQKKPIPKAIIIIHPLIGLLGIIALVAFAAHIIPH
jgi:hypothetical protein